MAMCYYFNENNFLYNTTYSKFQDEIEQPQYIESNLESNLPIQNNSICTRWAGNSI